MEKECPYLYKQVINNDRDSCDRLAKESLKAYATLISAAPELYEALLNLVCCPAFTGKLFETDKESHKAWTLARAAIAKAEGR